MSFAVSMRIEDYLCEIPLIGFFCKGPGARVRVMLDGPDMATGGQGGGIAEAAGWVAGLMTGTLATAIATLAVAGIGFAMLQGRLTVRGAGRAVLGCFILFGAPYIAKGLAGGVRQAQSAPAAVYSAPPAPIAPPPAPQPDRDPYAGASVPIQ